MLLNEQIRESIDFFRQELPPELVSLIEQGAGEISSLDIVERAVKVGDSSPGFTLKDRTGTPRSLSDYLQDGPVVLTFYRGIWCPFCNMQLAAYNKHRAEFEKYGAQLIAVTPESEHGLAALEASNAPQEAKDTAKMNIDFDILHDENTKVSSLYGLVFELPDVHKKVLEMLNLDVEKANGNSSYAFADPATYVIGTDGMIKWAYVPNNYRKRAEPTAIIEQLKTLQQEQAV